MSSEPEAWEVIAGELPPGWTWSHSVPVNESTGRRVSGMGSAEANAVRCWSRWSHRSGITRRAYAESIAPRLVREAAVRRFGDRPFFVAYSYWAEDGSHAIRVTPEYRPGSRDYHGAGPDICTAAVEVIRALEGDYAEIAATWEDEHGRNMDEANQ